MSDVELDPGKKEGLDQKSNDKSKDDKNKEKKEGLAGIFQDDLKYYVVPGVMFLISFGLIVQLILPTLNSAFGNLDRVSELQEEYEDLQGIKERRNQLAQQIQSQREILTRIIELIPQRQTAVVDFSEDIREKAEDNDLDLQQSLVGEVVVVNTNSSTSSSSQSNSSPSAAASSGQDQSANTNSVATDTEPQVSLDLVELPAEFSIEGDFEDIRDFLASFYASDDFIIIKSMELQKQLQTEEDGESTRFTTSSSDRWIMTIELVKYQFRAGGEDVDEQALTQYFFNSVAEGARPNAEVLRFIEQNYIEE
jgi:Tfp pilus assembly protein PilO